MSPTTQYLQELRLFKEKHGCHDCGNKFPHYVLEFDHKPEHKKVDNVYPDAGTQSN